MKPVPPAEGVIRTVDKDGVSHEFPFTCGEESHEGDNAYERLVIGRFALLLSDEGENTFIEKMKVDMTDEPTIMSFEEALRLMRDPQTSIPRQLVAGSILHASLPNLTDDDLLTIMHRYRSVAWWAAHELHDRTGRPRILGNDGFIVIDLV